jgi:hypothetical protein
VTVGTFVTVPFETDAETLADQAVDDLRTGITGWEPADGNLEVWLIEATARIGAEVATVAAQVPPAIFDQFGQQMVGVARIAGTRATITTIWTARDNLGYTALAGTQVAHKVTGDDLIVFETIDDVTIAPGATALGGVVLQATEVGTAWNGVPTGDLDLVDALSWVESVTATTTSSGGINPETDVAYLDRLTAELRLLTPRPILPDDFATLARNVTGVYRALAINGYDPGTNEVQTITEGGSGLTSYTLTYSAQITTSITANAAASAVQSALEALSNIAVGDVAVTGSAGGPYTVTFGGALASTNVAQMTATPTGGTGTVTINTVTPGVASSTGNERYVCVVPVDEAGAAVSPTIRADVVAYLDGLREVSFVVKATTPTYTTVNVDYTIAVATNYVAVDVKTACDAAITAYLSPGTWAGGAESPPVWRAGQDKVRLIPLGSVIAAVAGVAYVATVEINGVAGDFTLPGVAPLPSVGTITGTVL